MEVEKVIELYKQIHFLEYKKIYPKISKIGLYPGQQMFLIEIAKNRGITQNELVHKTKREAATITKAIQRLETKEYIKRLEDEKDRRVSHLYLTDKGEKIVKKIKEIEKENNKLVKESLNKNDLENAYIILKKLKKALESEE